MKTVKIFIASSIVEFEQERDKLAARLRGLNENQHNIDFQVKICEDYSHTETPRRKQEELNELVRQCDFFFAIIGADVGKATLEEIDVAREQFRKSGSALSPKIVVFFRDLPMEELSAEVIQLKIKLREMGQYPSTFTHISEVTRDILMELINADAFFESVSLEAGRRIHEAVAAKIEDNRCKIAELSKGDITEDIEAELLRLYQENVAQSRKALLEWKTFYEYALFLHKRHNDAKAVEVGTELEKLMEETCIPYDTPHDRATLKNLLGDCYTALGNHENAGRYYRAALDTYRELVDDKTKKHTDMECSETPGYVPNSPLVDGIKKAGGDEKQEMKYSGMSLNVEHMEGVNIIMDSQVGESAEIRTTHKAMKSEPERTELTLVDKSTIRNTNADTRLKTLSFIAWLCGLFAVGYLLITKNVTLWELLKTILENLSS